MPRLKNDLELLRQLQTVERIIPATPAVTASTNAAVLAAATTLAFATTPSGFADKDIIILAGTGGVELNEVKGSPSASTALRYPVAYAHEEGLKIYKAQVIDLGPIAEGGVQRTGQQQVTPVPIANSRLPLGYVKGTTTLGFSFGLMGENNLNLLAAFGIDEAETGAGTAISPHQVAVSGTNVGAHGLTCFRARGIRNDSAIIECDINAAQVVVNANHALGATTPQAYTVAGNCGNMVQKIYL